MRFFQYTLATSFVGLLLMLVLALMSGQQLIPQRMALYGIAVMGLVEVICFLLAIWHILRRSKTGVKLAHVLALILVSGGITAWNASIIRQVGAVPAIHDITTDTENPPQFVGLLAVRQAAPNGAVYKGAEIAGQQAAAYPDLKPIITELPSDRAFAQMDKIVSDLGWEKISNPSAGLIEATTRTAMMGFVDDIVIRVQAEGSGSRIDIRSMSRLGQSDLGANAARIRMLTDSFNQQAQ